MKYFFTIIKYDYLQRTRSYTFLITLCASLAIAYTFVPAPDANYSTLRVDDYVGEYNSAWFGYVTAIMTSVFLSLIGFYVINGTIRTDNMTKVGQIVSGTPITNFSYLLAKAIGNFLMLLTLVGIIFLMSLMLFFFYNDGFDFELMQFVKPYLIIALPALFFISAVAVVFEVIFKKYTVVQNIGFFFLFSLMLVVSPKTELEYGLDIFGTKIITNELQQTVRQIKNTDESKELSIGYVIGSQHKPEKFVFEGYDFPLLFVVSRMMWVLFGVLLLLVISRFFHRFDTRELFKLKKTEVKTKRSVPVKDLAVTSLPEGTQNYSIWPLVKTEFLMLLRKGKKWLWAFNLLGMILLAVLPIPIAHQIVLPILWFLQVHRLSDITTKEVNNKMHFLTFSSYSPLKRLLASQLTSAVVLMMALAAPLIVRYALGAHLENGLSIILGGIFLVLFAAVLGQISKGKKLFELLFFLLTYANINRIPFMDYFGGVTQGVENQVKLAVLILILVTSAFLIRKQQLTRQ